MIGEYIKTCTKFLENLQPIYFYLKLKNGK